MRQRSARVGVTIAVFGAAVAAGVAPAAGSGLAAQVLERPSPADHPTMDQAVDRTTGAVPAALRLAAREPAAPMARRVPTRSREDVTPAQDSVVERLRLVLQPDEARATLQLLERRAAGEAVPEGAWRDVFATEGYRRMMEREKSMDEQLGLQRGYSDESFRAWAESDGALARLSERRRGLQAWDDVDVRTAGEMASAYLPEHARIRATVYPLIRKQTNSFVHDLCGEDPAIFMHVAPDQTAGAIEHTLAHEFHHVGLAEACSCVAGREDAARAILGGFAEGVAVLAAAGGPDRETHPTEGPEARANWDRRLDSLAVDMAAFEAFMDAVLAGDLTGDEAVRGSFRFSSGPGVPQGAFYSVGWHMASTIERELGRATLVDGLCRPERLLLDYDVAAAAIAARDPATAPPRWSDRFLDQLRERIGRI